MPLTKVCEQCSTSVNVMKSVCVCGHTFAKSSVTRQSKRIAMKRKRAVESELETAARQCKDRDRKAQKRALLSIHTETRALKCKTLGGIHMQSTAAMQRCVYTAHARASASLPRVGLRLYLACFTPFAPVASL